MYTNKYRKLIVGVDKKISLVSGKIVTPINFDNAATTPPFVSVMKAINEFAPWYSSIHRGTGYKSEISSFFYESSRQTICDFVGANPDHDAVIFVKNTTEAINKLSYRLCNKDKDYVILSTCMEHHSNDLPWRDKYKVDYISIDSEGRLSLGDLENKLIRHKGNVKLVTVCGASNVTGYVNPIYKIASLVHQYGAMLLVDGAQLIPHVPFDMKPLNSPEHIDFVAFSAHKMYAPFGVGVLIGPKEIFQAGPPEFSGGGTVKLVTHDFVKWLDPPQKEEAGTPNIMGVVALISSIKTLNKIGMKNIEEHEDNLCAYLLEKLKKVPGVTLYGNTLDCKGRVGIIPFNIEGFYCDITSKILSMEAGIGVRSGCFCAHPYVQKLLKIKQEEIDYYKNHPNSPRPGMARISLGLYNTFREADILVDSLIKITNKRDHFIKKYSTCDYI
ncbi:MAG: aminotransferase class V-fold PLP-dependent enzyme [Bacillota bacterium]|nr:aminotransferase class V-fold PLP-dependent enzyme [Bacillota bacterium]